MNRVWANFFGVGLVEAVDDLRLTNPASNEELLSAAAMFLVEQNYDLKELMRAILQSETYHQGPKTHETTSTFFPFVTPPLVQSQCQPGNAT